MVREAGVTTAICLAAFALLVALMTHLLLWTQATVTATLREVSPAELGQWEDRFEAETGNGRAMESQLLQSGKLPGSQPGQ